MIAVSAFVLLIDTESEESSAQDHISAGQCGRNVSYYLYSDGTLEIFGSGDMYQYGSSPAPWYKYRDSIAKIVVSPASESLITKLGAGAFRDCKNVTEITIPITLNSVVSDKNPVFSGCTNIEKINLTFGNGGYGFSYSAFEGSDSWYQNTPWYLSRDTLKEIDFAYGVRGIGGDAFRELNITSLVLPDTVVHLGIHCFLNCAKLTDLTIPVSLNPYGSDTTYPPFRGCTAVRNVTITNGTGVPFDYTSWYSNDSSGSEWTPWNLEYHIGKTIIIKDDVARLGRYMFYDCNITDLVIPISIDVSEAFPITHTSSVKRAGTELSYPNLKKVTITEGTGSYGDFHIPSVRCPWASSAPDLDITIEEGVTYLGDCLFSNGTIENLTLPNSLTSLGKNTFQHSKIKNLTIPISLNTVLLDGTPAFADDVYGIERIDFVPGSGYGYDYFEESHDGRYRLTPWYICRDTLKEIYFAEGIKHIGSYAFDFAFYDADGETKLGQTVENMLCSTFGKVEGKFIKQKEYGKCGEGVTYELDFSTETLAIGGSGMMNSYSDGEAPWFPYKDFISSIIICDSVESLGANAFAGCTSLASVTISGSVTTIETGAFDGKFYDFDGENELEPTAANLAGSKFGIMDGNWIKLVFGECGESVTYDLNLSTGVLSINGSGKMKSYFNGEAPWFPYKDIIASIFIGDSVQTIGSSAFRGCASLASVAIGDHVSTIESYAFDGCTSLTSVAFGYHVSTIESFAFVGCTSLTSVAFGYHVSTIESFAFDGCTSLTSVAIPDSVRSIGAYVFSDCTSLTSVRLPDSLTSLGAGVFYNCSGLTSVAIPDSVTYIGKYAFYGCASLTSLSLPDALDSIGSYAFSGCTSVTSIVIPGSVTFIGGNAFDGKFYDVAENELEQTAANLAGSISINIDGKWIRETGVCGEGVTYKLDIFAGVLTIGGSGKMDSYLTGEAPWFPYKDIIASIFIGDSVETIGSSAFLGCTSLASVHIGDNVSSIESSVFEGCTSLTSVTLPDSVRSLGHYSFSGCTSLISIGLPDSLIYIGARAFYNCSGLTSVAIPDSVTSIAMYTFYGCTSLYSLSLPVALKSIGSYAFKGCTPLSSIVIPGTVTFIGDNVFDGKFYDLSGENELEPTAVGLAGSKFLNFGGRWIKQNISGCCGDGVTYNLDLSTGALTIGGSGRMDCYSYGGVPWSAYCAIITSISIDDPVEYIEPFAFRDCTSLTSVHLSDSLTSIAAGTFYNCSGLASLSIPDSVTSIGNMAFYGCASLASLSLPDILDSIGFSAFSGCSSLTTLIFPGSITYIGEDAFDGNFYGLAGENELEPTAAGLAGSKFINIGGRWIKQNISGCCGEGVTYDLDFSTGVLSICGSGKVNSYSNGEAPWFIYKDSITSIVIGDSVESVGFAAFRGCTSLTSIAIPDSVRSIGPYAFENCTSLISVHLPDSLTALSAGIFFNCSGLASVAIPDSVTYIGIYAFAGCTSLTSIAIPDSVEYLYSTFENCTSLISVDLPDSLKSVDRSFYNCSGLTSVAIPDSVTSISNNAFYGCASLTSLSLSDSLVSIGSSAFSGCTSLASVSLPDSVVSIGTNAFSGCTSLVTLGLGNSVETIGASAFTGCTSLATLIIPGSVISIGDGAFDGKFYDFDGENELEPSAADLAGYKYRNIDGKWFKVSGICGEGVTFEFDPATGTLTIGGSGKMNSYSDGNAPWISRRDSIGTVVIGDSVETIGASAFRDTASLTSVIIGDHVVSIDFSAFESCTSLTSITIPDSVKVLGSYAFRDCASLTSAHLSAQITSLGAGIFYNCSGLTFVAVPDSFTSIGNYMFYGCSALPALSLPDALDSIGPYAFGSCTSLTSLSLPDALASIGPSAFSGCVSLSVLSLPDALASIGPSAFSGCKSLTVLSLPDALASIGPSAFSGCTSLTTLSISKSVASIGNRAFDGKFYDLAGENELEPTAAKLAGFKFGNVDGNWIKENGVCGDRVTFELDYSTGTLTIGGSGKMGSFHTGAPWVPRKDFIRSIVIGDSVETIGYTAFSGCTSLTSVVIGKHVVSIDSSAFEGCTSLTSIVIPDSVRSLGQYVFGFCTSLTSVSLPDSLTDIEPRTFYNCSGLISVAIPDSVTTIELLTFFGCTSLTAVSLPDTIESIGSSAFSGCVSLATVNIPDSVRTLERNAFSGCSSLTTLHLGDSVESIGASAFEGCTSLKKLILPGSVTSIGDCAFDGKFYGLAGENELEPTAANLAGFKFGNIDGRWVQQNIFGNCGEGVIYELDFSTGTLTIGGSGKMDSYFNGEAPWFTHKDSITSIVIGDSVKTVGSYAFQDCTALTSVLLSDGVSAIESFAFERCASLTSISIPDSVISIGAYVFSDCASLTSVHLSGSLVSIEACTFYKCSGLVSADIPDSVTSIGDYAFYGCTSLTVLSLPDALHSIGSYAFNGCTSIATLDLGNSVASIGRSAFNGCTSFTTLILPGSITSIGDDAFDGRFYDLDGKNELEPTVADLAGSTFDKVKGKWVKQAPAPPVDPNKVSGECGEDVNYELDLTTGALSVSGSGKMNSYSGGNAPWFSHRDSIKSIEIADSVTSIGDHAFEGITAMNSISIPDSVETIGAFAFEGCTDLATVNLGKSVNSVGKSAFEGCPSLVSYVVSEENGVYRSVDGVLFSRGRTVLVQYPAAKEGISYEIPDTVTYIKSSAFKGCKFLASINIPDSVTYVEEGAFDMVFYDPAGENVLEQTVENLAGSNFDNKDGKWVKQASVPQVDPDKVTGGCGENVTYELDFTTGALSVSGSGNMSSYSSGSAPWSSYKDLITSIIIGASVTSIGDFAFEGITSVESISLSDSVETIGAFAFEGCTELATVTFGKSVNSLDMSAFNGCSSLASFIVSEDNGTYSSLGGVLFSKDKSVLIQYPVAKTDAFYEIPVAVKIIRSSVFKGCAFLVSITIPGSVETVEADAFDMIFCDPTGENVLEQTVENLAGSTFCKADGKFFKQKEFGKCGDAVKYDFDLSSGVLAIYGSGEMSSYSDGEAPWFSHRASIRSVEIADSVTSIGDHAFEGITSIESVTISDSVETIGTSAFEGCTSLATVNLGNSINSIGGSAFSGCSALASYVVSENNGTYTSIDGVLFSKDKSVLVQYPAAKECATYEISDTVTTIGSAAFKVCASLASIIIPDSLTSIEEGAFNMVFYDPAGENVLEQTVENLAGFTFDNKDGKWIKQASVPPVDPDKVSGECGEGVTYELDLSEGTLVIGGHGRMESYSYGEEPWCSHRDSIRSVEIADSVTSIGDFAFEGITSIQSISIPDSVETIGASAFEGCSNLATINLGHFVCSIDRSAFKGCTSLTSITIPDSVESLGVSAFDGCIGLKELTVPASLDCVRSNVNPCFSGCVNIETVILTKGDGTWYSYDTGSSQAVSPRSSSRILNDVVPGYLSEQSDYRYTPWQLSRSVLTSVIISEGVTSIGDSAFRDCSAINSLTLANSVAVIGDSAFSDCTSLSFVVIPDSVVSIGESAFRVCKSLTSIVIPDSVDSIGESAFEDCTSLSSVTLPDTSGSIGESVFSGCSSLTTFNVSEESLKYSILNGVLYNKDRTELIWYPAGNTDTSFEIPFGVTSIGANAFGDNVCLASVTIPYSVTSISDTAFSGKFYDTDGISEISQTASDMAGFTFEKTDGKWIRQGSVPSPSPSDTGSGNGSTTIYLIIAMAVIIALSVAVAVAKKRHARIHNGMQLRHFRPNCDVTDTQAVS